MSNRSTHMVYQFNTKLVPVSFIGGYIEGGKGHPGCEIATASTSASIDSGSTDETLVVDLMERLNAATEESTLF